MSQARQRLFCVVALTDVGQHAYEVVRVETSSNDHDAEFGTKIHAVDRRARHLLGLEAINASESWPRYLVRGQN